MDHIVHLPKIERIPFKNSLLMQPESNYKRAVFSLIFDFPYVYWNQQIKVILLHYEGVSNVFLMQLKEKICLIFSF